MKYEPWFQFPKKKKKNPYPFVRYLWCSIKYVWHLSGLTWVAKQLWQSKPRQVCQSGGWEGEWMGPSLAARNINRSVTWPVTSVYQLMKHRARWVEVGCMAFFTPPALWNVERFFFLLAAKAGLDSSAQRGGATERAITPPTQSWSSTVFKKEKQSQNSTIWIW